METDVLSQTYYDYKANIKAVLNLNSVKTLKNEIFMKKKIFKEFLRNFLLYKHI